MFNKKELDLLDKKIITLASNISNLRTEFNEHNNLISSINSKIIFLEDNFKAWQGYIENKIRQLEEKISINYMEGIFKDITLIDKLVRNSDYEKDFNRVRAELLKPILEERYKIEEKIKGNNIDFSIKTKGDKIREKRKQLYEQQMFMKKNNKDTKEIEAEIKGLDFILEAK